MPDMGSEKILPQDGKRNILITSALPYVNNVPHLGNIVGSVLSADVFSRYNKARGRPTLFVCGTDEYGTATETKALEEGVTPEELCAKYNKIHAEIYEWFELGFDIFGRTPTRQHTEISQEIFLQLQKNGHLTEHTNSQPFCEKHGKFLADRFVEGTCPKCGYDDARGDQCDKCGSLLDPLDLINPRCKVDGATPVTKETKHTYLRLDELQPRIEEWSKQSIEKGGWSRSAKIITESWLKQGLKERGITRDLAWGVPVPLPGYEHKVLYVWFEACIGYPSITANYTEEWQQWWKNPEHVQLYQFMGKDNVPFHSVIFPGCQMGSGESWTQLHHLSSTEYLNYENGKFSKSRGIGVFGNNAKETGIPPDVWRYYLLKNRPESGDTQFEWRSFIDGNNSELLAKLGNFVNRIIKLVNSPKAYSGVIPDFDPQNLPSSFKEPLAEITDLLKQYLAEMEAVRLRNGVLVAMKIAEAGNGLIQAHRLDNSLVANDPTLAAAVVGTVINLIYLCSAIFEPYLPATCASIRKQLDVGFLLIPSEEAIFSGWLPTYIHPGHKIGKAEYLFTRIDEKKADEWREYFGGNQAEREKKKKEEAELAAKKAAQKEKVKAKKAAQKAAAAVGGEGVEMSAKGGKKGKHLPNGVTEGDEDAAVEKVVDGVAQVTIPTS
ncbi:methionine-tRNA ligase [Rhinocladiella mackenziei CBS 650.93]|uniref:methionine--tRNA ligase n=1 Tax=Rhinocladiella mackenziei CBS 650.93 TaxID=1442369 RepID=A0A0D2HB64_9EURO|nr:methionine-tRNA ligase [Rhinocladiella mackenziei CBS 650.93]KIX07678.1 methionine-tRNA ligase [Rhinocladiella mackenziei CBS 650.93]